MKRTLITLLVFSVFISYAQSDDYFLMPYRDGNKWGLSDTLGNVKIKPVYDGFTDMIVDSKSMQSFYFVKQNYRTIVIDHKNVQQLKQYDSLDPLSKHIYKDGKVGIYKYVYGRSSAKGNFNIVTEPLYDKIEEVGQGSIYIITSNGKKGLLWEDYYSGTSIPLKPLYDKIVFDKPFYKGWLHGSVVATFKVPDDLGGNIAPQPRGKKEKAEAEAKQEYEDQYKKKQIAENITNDASPEDLNNTKPFEITDIHKYVKYREGNKQGYAQFYYRTTNDIRRFEKNMIIPAIYDSISEVGINEFLIKQNGKYGLAMGRKITIEPIYDEVKFDRMYADDFLLKKDNKYAVYNLYLNKIITDFEFDGYDFIKTRENTYYTILRKGKKKILWDNKSASEEYDDIVPEYKIVHWPNGNEDYTDYVKFKKDGKYGILFRGKTLVPIEFDDVSGEAGFYVTINKGLKGAYSGEKIKIPPKYKSITQFKDYYLNGKTYFLFKVVNPNGVTFYIDSKGKEFYKE